MAARIEDLIVVPAAAVRQPVTCPPGPVETSRLAGAYAIGMETMMTSSHRNPGVASVLSLLVPGVGQFYNGDFLRGLFWLIVTPGLWIGSGGLLGWICHLIAAVTAYRRAELKNRNPYL